MIESTLMVSSLVHSINDKTFQNRKCKAQYEYTKCLINICVKLKYNHVVNKLIYSLVLLLKYIR